MQKRILDPRTRELRLRATGYGMAAVQVGYQYSLDVTAAWPSFVVNPQVFKPSTANHMQFTVCVNYIEGGNRDERVFLVSFYFYDFYDFHLPLLCLKMQPKDNHV